MQFRGFLRSLYRVFTFTVQNHQWLSNSTMQQNLISYLVIGHGHNHFRHSKRYSQYINVFESLQIVTLTYISRGFNVSKGCPTWASSSIHSPTWRRNLPYKDSQGSQKLPWLEQEALVSLQCACHTVQITWNMTERNLIKSKSIHYS